PLHVERSRLAELEARVEGVRARALEVDALERRLAGRDEEIHRLVALKTGRPGVTQLLDEVTRRLPDDTWVVQFALRDGRITLAGFSAAASALVAPLEASALLREVRFGAPVYTDPQVGLERFTLSAMVERGGGAGTARDGE
ncbi:MAG TPA: PilN domain-containing protein, partial [Arenibaculum sp.]|nr:PilN domain-containing protein [Arenibaculum sp.]